MTRPDWMPVLQDRFGLSDDEAEALLPVLLDTLGERPEAAPEEAYAARRRKLADTNANLAIENLALAEPELAFLDFVDRHDLAPDAAARLRRAYTLARLRSLGAQPRVA